LQLEVEHHWLDVDTAIPCGLIINELVSNSFKYAFESRTGGQVYVKLRREGDKFLLRVEDNGIGLPADFELEENESLGLQLVLNLTAQLGGDISLKCSKGTCFEITFTLSTGENK
jgi:two-component sensor histidine kinase